MAAYGLEKKTDEELKEITDQVVKQMLKSESLNIKKIILYGSYARGTADAGSDIDILVLCDNREEDLDRLRYSANIVSSRISLDKDVDVAMTLKDMDIYNKWVETLPYYKNVEQEGIVLYG